MGGNSPTKSLKVIVSEEVWRALKIRAMDERINLGDLCAKELERLSKKEAKR